jgi:DNA mismatch repair protein MutS2
MNRHYKTLELDKILERLAGMTSIEDAREMALNLEPVFELKKVEQLLQQTDDAVALSGRFGAPSFGGAGNCSGHLRRAQAGGCLTTGELLSVASTLRTIRTVKEWHSRSGGGASSLDGYFSGLVSNKFLEDKITSAIISEEEISDKASPVLSDIRRKIRTASSKAREVLDKIIHSSTYIKYLQDTIVTQRDGRYVVPVRSECRGNVPGLVHDTSSSGATVFIEPMGVVQANNDIKLLQSKEEQEIERILFELSANAGEFADSIIHSYKNLAQLNLIFAKADLAYSMKASKPIMNDRGMIELKQARHPLIDKNKVVPVDVMLGKEFDTLVITGPNTGFYLDALCSVFVKPQLFKGTEKFGGITPRINSDLTFYAVCTHDFSRIKKLFFHNYLKFHKINSVGFYFNSMIVTPSSPSPNTPSR